MSSSRQDRVIYDTCLSNVQCRLTGDHYASCKRYLDTRESRIEEALHEAFSLCSCSIIAICTDGILFENLVDFGFRHVTDSRYIIL